ncbi:T9SS type A sorting domain-containing protein [bacterium]|nr:T9SS type A sorting domain-containing protein [bacterium]
MLIMKKFILFLLFLIPLLGVSQTTGQSWFEIEMEFGQYTFNDQTILITQNNDTLYYQEYGDGYNNLARYRYAVVNADTGDIDIKLRSEYGGWYGPGTSSPAYIEMSNATQGIFYNPALITYGTFQGAYPNYTSETTINLLSQPPPIAGCMDSTSSSYNPNANLSNGQCTYPVSFAVDMNSYPDTFSQVYVSGQFNSWSGIWDSLADPDGDNIWTGTIDILNNPGWLWKYSVDNWADQELPPNMQNNQNPYATCFFLDAYGFTNRNLIVDGAAVVLDTNCWEKCLDCEDIIGCTDSISTEFNPWATISDGLCQGSATGIPTCGPGQTYLDVQFTPDTYGGESSWILYDDNGAVYTATQGTYSGSPQGVAISHYICVDTNVLVDIIINDSYGDGLNGTLYGGQVDGDLKVYDCNGNVLWSLSDTIPNGNFGYQFLSPQFSTGSACSSGSSNAVSGCMNPFSTTYNPNATVSDGTCGPPRVVGCTDTSSFNYDLNANTSEVMTGTYTLKIYDGASNGWGGTWLGIKQGDNLSPQFQIGPDDGNSLAFDVPLNIYEPIELYLFTTPQSANSIAQVAYTLYGPEGDTIVDVPYWGAITVQFPIIQTTTAQPTFGDVCIEKVFGCTDSTSFNYDSLANTNDGSCVPIIIGCMNDQSFNYDSTANVAGDCIPIIVGCMDSTSFNYDSTANTAGACIPIIVGCMDSTSFNFNPLANTPSNNCIPKVYGCTDPTSFNYDSLANTDDGTCIARVYGCTDTSSLNYNPLANTDNGSCIAKVFGCMNPQSLNFNPLANVNDGSCIARIYGCTDSTSFNYNPLANTDDSSCVPVIYGCTNPSSKNYNPLANTDDGSCIPFIYGCTDSTSFNYNPLANTDNGTCIPKIYGCTDPTAFNYNPNANTEDFSCIPIVYGCTDSTSVNYDPLANTDNGTCITAIYGCTDPNAHNYNPNANVSDTTACVYDAGCIDGPGNPYWLNDPCYAWVIDVDEYCCTNSWDPDCQALYDYCATQSGTLDLDELAFNNIVVFPNPTTGNLNIKTNLDITYTLYDFTGRVIIENSDAQTIDITTLPNGVYFLSIKHHDKVFNKRIVKED